MLSFPFIVPTSLPGLDNPTHGGQVHSGIGNDDIIAVNAAGIFAPVLSSVSNAKQQIEIDELQISGTIFPDSIVFTDPDCQQGDVVIPPVDADFPNVDMLRSAGSASLTMVMADGTTRNLLPATFISRGNSESSLPVAQSNLLLIPTDQLLNGASGGQVGSAVTSLLNESVCPPFPGEIVEIQALILNSQELPVPGQWASFRQGENCYLPIRIPMTQGQLETLSAMLLTKPVSACTISEGEGCPVTGQDLQPAPTTAQDIQTVPNETVGFNQLSTASNIAPQGFNLKECRSAEIESLRVEIKFDKQSPQVAIPDTAMSKTEPSENSLYRIIGPGLCSSEEAELPFYKPGFESQWSGQAVLSGEYQSAQSGSLRLRLKVDKQVPGQHSTEVESVPNNGGERVNIMVRQSMMSSFDLLPGEKVSPPHGIWSQPDEQGKAFFNQTMDTVLTDDLDINVQLTDQPKSGAVTLEPLVSRATSQSGNVAKSDIERFRIKLTKHQLDSLIRRGEVRLRLHPEHLGAMRIKLVTSGSEVSARFEIGSEAARQALECNLPQLRENLEKSGIRLDSVELVVTGEQEKEGRHTDYQPWNSQTDTPSQLVDSPSETEESGIEPAGVMTHTGGLNLLA